MTLFALFLLSFGAFSASTSGQEQPPGEQPHIEEPRSETTLDYFWRKSDEAFHAGDYSRAIGLHRAIVALDPHDVESYSVAAWLLWSMGEGEAALSHIEHGLSANPKNWEMWDAAGQHYDLQKRATPILASRAKEAYARAVELLPEDVDGNEEKMLRRRLAHAAEKADDLPLSIATWRGLVRDFPDDAVHQNNLKRVEQLSDGAKLIASFPLRLSLSNWWKAFSSQQG